MLSCEVQTGSVHSGAVVSWWAVLSVVWQLMIMNNLDDSVAQVPRPL